MNDYVAVTVKLKRDVKKLVKKYAADTEQKFFVAMNELLVAGRKAMKIKKP